MTERIWDEQELQEHRRGLEESATRYLLAKQEKCDWTEDSVPLKTDERGGRQEDRALWVAGRQNGNKPC